MRDLLRLIMLTALFAPPAALADRAPVLDTRDMEAYVQQFNADDEELYAHIPNDEALEFLQRNVPRFDCPDVDFERTFYFRWWTYRKHVKRTDDGYVVTEFLPDVNWSGKHNTIVCPVGHHFYEGRWLHDAQILDDYAVFWLRGGGQARRYSSWLADAYFARHLVTPSRELLVELLPDLIAHYETWQKGRKHGDFQIGQGDSGLFAQIDDRDGMEVSIGGSGYRATLSSYMFGDAKAIAQIARMARDDEVAARFDAEAERIRKAVMDKLWDEDARFFKVKNQQTGELADVREQHGYTPWYFHLPTPGQGFEVAWKQLMDPEGFHAPFGPTTAEQRHPGFKLSYEGHECQWNGPSWPLSTSVTLTALANVLNDYDQNVVTKRDYFETLAIYTRSHQRTREDGTTLPWIDENLHPHTGDWISRTRLKSWKDDTWDPGKGGKERGKDYNHSTYNDLIITGLVGLRPRLDHTVEVNPLLPDDTWDHFCLDHVKYHGRLLTILWDKTGKHYNKGQGLTVLADGKVIANAPTLQRVTGELTPTVSD